MPADVAVYGFEVSTFMDIVRELRAQGLVQGKDFDFKYIPTTYDDTGFQVLDNRHMMFTFYNEKYATLFALKYST